VAVEARTHTHAHHPQLLASQTFDVTTYGALGDGKTDDSAAVAKAASAMEACNCIGALYFPAGRFVLNNSYDGEAGDAIIALRTPGQYTILGAGVDSTILRWDSALATAPPLSIICSLLVSNKTPRRLIHLEREVSRSSEESKCTLACLACIVRLAAASRLPCNLPSQT
jgi:hypothetical protein